MRWPEVQQFLILIFCCSFLASAFGQSNNSWKTLDGEAPLVVARGGFSGLLPDSSVGSYGFVYLYSLPDTVLWCDVQLTKDNVGICYPDLRLDNSSNAEQIYGGSKERRQKTHFVNGVHVTGLFALDFTLDELSIVSLTQGIYSRPDKFDGSYPILTVHNFTNGSRHAWLNIQHDVIYAQHNLSMRSLVLSLAKKGDVDFISSPELQFVKDTATKLNTNKTQLIFRFLGPNEKEPTTNQTYGSLLKNLTDIKKFASGILVPKEYIWPVDASGYLLAHTSVVSDAHSVGLKVFAAGFANDYAISYNYSYDPVEEYLSFLDNGNFSVDGLLSDFPVTASAAIGCYSHVDKKASQQEKPLIISFEGASGDYPGCTNLAYERAISGGADVIDCPVQMTREEIPVCMGSINLINSTNVLQTPFGKSMPSYPEIGGRGIYTFLLTWDEIQTLKPQISNPHSKYNLFRNPKAKHAGKLQSLGDFLKLGENATSLSGILISVENAAFLEIIGYDVVDAVIRTLSKAELGNSSIAKKVMIQSTSSAVLKKFREKTSYKLVYNIDELVQDVLNSTIQDIKSFADAVVLHKGSVQTSYKKYLEGETHLIRKFHAYKLPVYVKLFENEFVSQAWDYLSDPRMEINTFVNAADADGIVTSFPKTAAAYRRNKCLGSKNSTPKYMLPAKPGDLLSSITGGVSSLGPAQAPLPVLADGDVNEPALTTYPSFDDDTPVGDSSGSSRRSKIIYIIAIILIIVTTFIVFTLLLCCCPIQGAVL